MKGALQLAALFDTSLSSDLADKCISILVLPFITAVHTFRGGWVWNLS